MMKYHSTKPSPELAPYVRHYLLVENDLPDTASLEGKLFPAGSLNIAFYPKGDIRIYIRGRCFPCTEPAIIGMSDIYKEYSYSPQNVFGVIGFQPTGFCKLFGLNCRPFINRIVPLRHYLDDAEYFENLRKAAGPEEYAQAHEKMLLKKLKSPHYLPPVIDQCVEDIYKSKGSITVRELLEKYKCSRSYLDKHFAYVLGTSPGKYAKLVRFLLLLREIEVQQATPANVFMKFNYYDLSHFIRDFEHYMGEKPQSYYSKEYPMIRLMVKKGQFKSGS